MLLKLLILLYFLHSLCLAEEENVLELTDESFEATLSDHDTALIMFYAPWCGHCKNLKPEYAQAASELKEENIPVALFKIDCTEKGKETCGKYGVEGYPTLKVFQNGEFAYEYDGPREASGIVSYMKGSVGSGSEEITSLEDLEKFLTGKEDACVVGFFSKESDLKRTFMETASKLRRKIDFAHTSSETVLEAEGIEDGVVLYRPKHLWNKFENDNVAYSGEGSLEDFIKKNRHGLVGFRTQNNQKEFESPLIVAFYNVDFINDPKGTTYWRNRVFKVAQNYKDEVNFAFSSKYDFYEELSASDVTDVTEKKPFVLAINSDKKKFTMNEDFSVEALDRFVRDFLDGNLQPYIKSEPIPEKNEGPVLVAVAKNFDDIVVNNDKDTLVEFYAPWCGHCKQLAPIYEKLAKKLKDEDIAVVKMDATANDVPENYTVNGFPTIYWKTLAAKYSPSLYQDGRKLDDFIKFVAKHATSELKSFDRNGKSRKIEKTEL